MCLIITRSPITTSSPRSSIWSRKSWSISSLKNLTSLPMLSKCCTSIFRRKRFHFWFRDRSSICTSKSSNCQIVTLTANRPFAMTIKGIWTGACRIFGTRLSSQLCITHQAKTSPLIGRRSRMRSMEIVKFATKYSNSAPNLPPLSMQITSSRLRWSKWQNRVKLANLGAP